MGNDEMMKNVIRLSLCLGAGNRRFTKLTEYFGTAEKLFNASKEELLNCGVLSAAEKKKLSKINDGELNEIIDYCDKNRIKILPFGRKGYPYCLSVIENPPVLLYYKGELPDFDSTPAICIVGPRKVSENGKKYAYSLGYRLAKAGMITVSGGALGSDTFAHIGALKGNGKTVLVLGCGIDSNYLPENAPLRERIIKSGCLISEYPPKSPATKYTFPVRNRIMAALCVGTVVVEAGEKSGSLITASLAAEQGRDVFVIPGNPTAKECAGSNALLRDGAKPLIDITDIFNEYIPRFPDKINIEKAFEKSDKQTEKAPQNKSFDKNNKKILNLALSKEAEIVYNQLDKQVFYPEDIKPDGMEAGDILSALTELEFEGVIRALPGGRYEIVGKS